MLAVRNLRVRIRTRAGTVRATDGVSFDVDDGEVVAVVGESGCGKTVTALAIIGLLPANASASGEVNFRGRNVLDLPAEEVRALRGSRIAIVFQDALAALNPLHRVGDQVAESIRTHHPEVGRKQVRERVVELLTQVGIPNARQRLGDYPHQFSGGMRQRVVIAMAMANDPDLLIADEPTTALDVTTQAQVLEVLARARERSGSGLLLVTHDLGVVAGVADRVLVMYAGRIVESGDVREVFRRPAHPYTMGLLASLPRIDRHGSGALERIPGQPPSLIEPPAGCAFHPRCPFARLPDPCRTSEPVLRPTADGSHVAACHFAGELRPEDGYQQQGAARE